MTEVCEVVQAGDKDLEVISLKTVRQEHEVFCGDCGKQEEQGVKEHLSVLLGKRNEGRANATLLKDLSSVS